MFPSQIASELGAVRRSSLRTPKDWSPTASCIFNSFTWNACCGGNDSTPRARRRLGAVHGWNRGRHPGHLGRIGSSIFQHKHSVIDFNSSCDTKYNVRSTARIGGPDHLVVSLPSGRTFWRRFDAATGTQGPRHAPQHLATKIQLPNESWQTYYSGSGPRAAKSGCGRTMADLAQKKTNTNIVSGSLCSLHTVLRTGLSCHEPWQEAPQMQRLCFRACASFRSR
ncbi:hypothetical protein VTK26DRAFT_6938 [Humicola hyalothermophila]